MVRTQPRGAKPAVGWHEPYAFQICRKFSVDPYANLLNLLPAAGGLAVCPEAWATVILEVDDLLLTNSASFVALDSPAFAKDVVVLLGARVGGVENDLFAGWILLIDSLREHQ